MHKFLVCLVLVCVIAIENYFWPGWIAHGYAWTLGWIIPIKWQIVALLPVALIVAALCAFILGGLPGIVILAVLAVLPLLGMDLGWVDDRIYDVGTLISSNPKRPVANSNEFQWLHNATILGAAALLGIGGWAWLRRR